MPDRNPRKTWRLAFIPEAVRADLKRRLEAHVAAHWKDRCREVQVRFRGVFAYVDALPVRQFFMPGLTPEQRAQIEATPTHLCRLRYQGRPDSLGFAFYKYSDERYEDSFLPNGSFNGTPEECFDCAASVYLNE
jgi:hypothetical protein